MLSQFYEDEWFVESHNEIVDEMSSFLPDFTSFHESYADHQQQNALENLLLDCNLQTKHDETLAPPPSTLDVPIDAASTPWEAYEIPTECEPIPATTKSRSGAVATQSRPPTINPFTVALGHSILLSPAQNDVVERLVGGPSALVPESAIPQRREFYKLLIYLHDQNNDEPLRMAPLVTRKPVDLHRLYLAVRRKGGYVEVTKSKQWKSICAEANSMVTESVQAGTRLRAIYERYLLRVECHETGQDIETLQASASKGRASKRSSTSTLPNILPTKRSSISSSQASLLPVDLDSSAAVNQCSTSAVADQSFPKWALYREGGTDVPVDDLTTPIIVTEAAEQQQVPDGKVSRPAKKVGSKKVQKAATTTTEDATQPANDDALTATLQRLKDVRGQHEFSQKEVAESICGCFQTDISQTTVSRFENGKLSARNMENIRILLDDWLEKFDEAIRNGKTAETFLKESKQKAGR